MNDVEKGSARVKGSVRFNEGKCNAVRMNEFTGREGVSPPLQSGHHQHISTWVLSPKEGIRVTFVKDTFLFFLL